MSSLAMHLWGDLVANGRNVYKQTYPHFFGVTTENLQRRMEQFLGRICGRPKHDYGL